MEIKNILFLIISFISIISLYKPKKGLYILSFTLPFYGSLVFSGVKIIYVIGVFIVAGYAARASKTRDLSSRRKYIYVSLFMLVLSIYAYVAGKNGLQTFVGIMGSILILFIFLDLIKSKKSLEGFLVTFAASNVLVNLFILVIFLYGDINYIYDLQSTGLRLKGFTDNASIYAALQIFTISILLHFYSVRKQRLYCAAGIILCSITLLLSQSRSGIAAFVIAIIIISTISSIRHGSLLYSMSVLSAILVAGYGGALLISNMYNIDLQRIGQNNKVNVTAIGPSTVKSQRMYIYKRGLEAIAERPLGYGYNRRLSSSMNNVPAFYSSHNFILQHLAVYGILGGFIFLCIWFYPLAVACWRLLHASLPPFSLSHYLLISTVSFMIIGMFHSATNWICWWLMWASLWKNLDLDTPSSASVY
ncbi:O-antigen ligase family protein [Salinibacter ruber]|uniref:O-antigen ligase family protein n=1 Tax=Salinibacter ruber TaxID=146919 RepID=UPI0021677746|nr:O-antigen ligase family protein [Salinibacter ruber]MCS3638176.1 hypothetical protein [Salinibacter ruber]